MEVWQDGSSPRNAAGRGAKNPYSLGRVWMCLWGGRWTQGVSDLEWGRIRVCVFISFGLGAISTHPSENRWQPPKATGDCTFWLSQCGQWPVTAEGVHRFWWATPGSFSVSSFWRGKKKEWVGEITKFIYIPKKEKSWEWPRLPWIGNILSSAMWQGGR